MSNETYSETEVWSDEQAFGDKVSLIVRLENDFGHNGITASISGNSALLRRMNDTPFFLLELISEFPHAILTSLGDIYVIRKRDS